MYIDSFDVIVAPGSFDNFGPKQKNNFAGISLRLYQLRYPSIFCGLAKMLYDNILRSCGLIAKLISDDDSSRENGTIKIYDIETA